MAGCQQRVGVAVLQLCTGHKALEHLSEPREHLQCHQLHLSSKPGAVEVPAKHACSAFDWAVVVADKGPVVEPVVTPGLGELASALQG